jgi:orotidine-5'-phosphate decarboxylase
MTRNFRQLIEGKWAQGKALCIGLDSALEKIPESIGGDVRERLVAFNRAIIDATHDLACAYKPNSAFYEAHGDQGLAALRETIYYLNEVAPDVPVILDAKRADIGNTNEQYAMAAFDYLHADAITVHPYMGEDAMRSFFARTDKGIFVLCRTSNAGSGEFQNLLVDGEPLYKVVARHVATTWNVNGNCFAFVGATYPEELAEVRSIVGDEPVLTAGVGAQNGDTIRCIENGKNSNGNGLIINASRSIIFASREADFAHVARREAEKLDGEIRALLIQ